MASIAPNLRSIVDPDGAVILDIDGNLMLTLNASGAYVWRKLCDGAVLDEIIRDLTRDTGVDPVTAENDVREFFETLKARQLLRA